MRIDIVTFSTPQTLRARPVPVKWPPTFAVCHRPLSYPKAVEDQRESWQNRRLSYWPVAEVAISLAHARS